MYQSACMKYTHLGILDIPVVTDNSHCQFYLIMNSDFFLPQILLFLLWRCVLDLGHQS